MIVRRLILWLDDRLAWAPFIQHALRKAFPDHWSFMLGEVAAYCYMVLLFTGIWLGFAFDPSGTQTVYHGPYAPLDGKQMSTAYASTLAISLEMRGGLLIRQMHHWAANVFLAAIVIHAMRIFFTGAFRKPREINWIIGVTLLLLAMFAGFTGYSLPDDMLSGTGLRIAVSILYSIPFVGDWLESIIIGGQWPQSQFTGRLFFVHVFLMQGLIIGAIGAHMAILWHQKHTQFKGPGRTAHNVVGSPLWPNYAFKSFALNAAVAGVLAALGTFVEINPIWQYGYYDPQHVASPAQPDWYVGWLDGALRLGPNWNVVLWGHTIPPVFWPGIMLPAIYFTIVYAWPFIERLLRRDDARHELLDAPHDVPWRTAAGVAMLSFAAVLEIAGGDDVFAYWLQIPVESLLWSLRMCLWIVPLLSGLITYWICNELRARRIERGPETVPGTSVVLVRNDRGGYDIS